MTTHAWNFEDVDATNGPVNVFSLDFAAHGISVVGVMAPPEPEWPGVSAHADVWDTRYSFDGHAVPPNEHHNVLMLTGPIGENGKRVPGPYDFNFTFANPATSFSVTRPALIPNGSPGWTHPGWKIDAFDESGALVDTAGENKHAVTAFIDKQTFTVTGTAIRSIRFRSDGEATSIPGFLMDGFSMEVP